MQDSKPSLRDQKEKASSALRKLLFFSLAIIFLPLTSLFVSKKFVFEDYFHYSPDDSIIYAAIVAVVVVHIVLVGFIYFAWIEDDKQQIVFQKADDRKQD